MYPTQTIQEKIKQVIYILIPILIYQLANFSAQFIDTIMTGRYNEVHLAGVSVAGNIWTPFFTFGTGALSAIVPIVAQLYGKKKFEDISSAVRQFMYLSLVMSALFIAIGSIVLPVLLERMTLEKEVVVVAQAYLAYLACGIPAFFLVSVLRSFIDALGYTRISMLFMIWIVPLNMLCNYSMIYGEFGFAQMGGAGAGLGTAVAYWILLISLVVFLSVHPTFKAYRIFHFEAVDFKQWKESLTLGVPIGLAVFVEVGIFAFVGLLMSKYDTNVIAGHQAAINVSNLSYAFPMSISSALTIIIAYEVGRKKYKDARQYMMIGRWLALLIAIITLCIVYWNIEWVASLYGHQPEFLYWTTVFLRYSLLFQLFDALAAPIQGILRGYKDTKMPFILSVMGYWGVALPIAMGLDHLTSLGAGSYWIGLIVGLGVTGLFLAIRLKRVLKKYA